MPRALVGLGGNIEPRRGYLRQALRALDQAPLKLLGASSLYETEPMDLPDQAAFLNMAALLETGLEPLALLDRLQEIEAAAHKKVEVRRGPRTLDLDLWFWEDRVMETPRLSLPHPRIPQRPFVLVPMAEVAPDWRHPVNKLTALEMLQRLPKPWPDVKGLGPLEGN